MSLGAPPIPDEVDILWQHSCASSYEPVSVLDKKVGVILYWLIMLVALVSCSLLFVGIIQDYLNDSDRVMADLTSFLWSLIGYILFLFLFLKFKRRFPTSSRGASGIPLWLSQKHLGFGPSKEMKTNLIPIEEIQSLSAGYSEGAPSISVRLSTETLTLISSEAHILLQSLYTLRPDLKPKV